MRVLFAASECVPFVKTGGLADVVGALPAALDRVGVETRVLLPGYPALADAMAGGTAVAELPDLPGGGGRVVAAEAGGLSLLLLDAPALFGRPGNPYLGPDGVDWSDNAERFGALSAAAAQLARNGVGGWRPDVLHAHDWQAGLAPAWLHWLGGGPPSLLSIHNIAFQGNFPPEIAARLDLPRAHYRMEGYEFHGQVSFLKAGLVWAERIATVSPTYARELRDPQFGLGMEGVLAARGSAVSGILNGVDTQVWDPARDMALPARYDADSLDRRATNRAALADRFGIAPRADAPLFCLVSRLTRQKGIDLLLEALPRLLSRGASLVLLGSGERDLEDACMAAAAAHPDRVGVEIGYDEALSHLMQGGADAILVPSRFEPCGLTQLYGLCYGCLPVVARTGGLADSVIDANEAALSAGVATGVQFAPVTADALADAVARACDLFAAPDTWRRLQANAMAQDVGWDRAAAAYRALYEGMASASKERRP